MKVGFRTPSLSKSVSARTTGRLNRTAKRSVNPVYGKKGIGIVNDPKRAVYNNIYHETTVGVSDLGSGSESPPSDPEGSEPSEPQNTPPRKPIYKMWWFWVIAVLIAVAIGSSYGKKKEPEKVVEATSEPTETPEPTSEPTVAPTDAPTDAPTVKSTDKPKDKKTKKPKKKAIRVYVAASGNGECYHTSPDCSRMNGNVKRMKLKKAKKRYRACSICASGW